MTFNRGIIKACICLIALANIQCGPDGRGSEIERSTLTIHMADQDEKRNGVPFRFSTMVVDLHEPAAVFVQDQLRRIGVRMDVQLLEYGVVRQRFLAGDFEAAIPRLGQLDLRFGRPDAPNGYDNARVRAIVRSMEETNRGEDLDRLYREL